jgi:hypothetical protein
MIKPIKFDLKLSDGTTTLRTFDDLEENLTPALFEHFHSGKLAKWLRVRKLEELAEKVEALSTQHLNDKNELEVKLFKNLCEIFVSEVSEDDAHEAIEHYKTIEPSSENSNDDEVEQLKDEIEALKTEIELLKNPSIGENEGKIANDEQPEGVDETVMENDDELLKLIDEKNETPESWTDMFNPFKRYEDYKQRQAKIEKDVLLRYEKVRAMSEEERKAYYAPLDAAYDALFKKE